MLEKDLKKELKLAIKARNIERKDALRMIMGEIPRLNKKKSVEATEEEIHKIIRSLIKSEITRLTAANYAQEKSLYLSHLKSFLPEIMSKEKIKSWILNNIDFNDYNNNMQAMSTIMSNLQGKADGSVVKEILLKL